MAVQGRSPGGGGLPQLKRGGGFIPRSRDDARARPARGFWRGLVGRPALLLVWALALWGTLLGLNLAVSAFEVGPRETFARLLPGHEATAWHYLNAAAVMLAVFAWTVVVTAVVAGRRGRPEP